MICKESTMVSPDDRRILRSLARRVADIAAQPIQKERRGLWTKHNALKQVRPSDLRASAESQEMAQVGPKQHAEFALEYEKQLLEPFGLTGYGCCEDLTHKTDAVLSIRNLRKFVCSAWTDLESVINAVGDRYCVEWRQNPTDVFFTNDLETIRNHLQAGIKTARGTPLQIVLQEIRTTNNNPNRLAEWAALAIDAGFAV